MKASELIAELQQVIELRGDMPVYLDVEYHGLREIDEIGVDTEDTGCIIWAGDLAEAA